MQHPKVHCYGVSNARRSHQRIIIMLKSERCILYIHSAKVLIGHLEIRRFFRDVFPVL